MNSENLTIEEERNSIKKYIILNTDYNKKQGSKTKEALNIIKLFSSSSRFEDVINNTKLSPNCIIKYVYSDEIILSVLDNQYLDIFKRVRDSIMVEYLERFIQFYLKNYYKKQKLAEVLKYDQSYLNVLFRLIKNEYPDLFELIADHQDVIKNRVDIFANGDRRIVSANMVDIVNDSKIRLTSSRFNYLENVVVYLENNGDIDRTAEIFKTDKNVIYSILNNKVYSTLLKNDVRNLVNTYLYYDSPAFFGNNKNAFLVTLVQSLFYHYGKIELVAEELKVPVGVVLRMAVDHNISMVFDSDVKELLEVMVKQYNKYSKKESSDTFALKKYKPIRNL